ncbi:cell division septum initiation protein DivIVA [Actinokineospora baliensis]|uniref:hypothetical protein n=1 Tax=Actinokineospora baliensis TaxID=547056 RepID=UPI0019580C59|nr:hypothetical protein [Actinokineospora baliensis]MBM7776081.1 cell division septum initiation protein DivIVA [Actinokineospora baliensis]
MTEMVPLATGFDVSWRGYRKRQVHHYVACVETDLRTLAEDRDAAAAKAQALTDELERVRREAAVLRTRVDRLCRTPVDLTGAEVRARRVIELAHAEAEEVLARARSMAERTWSTVRAMETAARERHDRLTRKAEVDHQALTKRTHDLITTQAHLAEQSRRELDERARALRDQVHTDFTTAMSARRAEQNAELASLRASAEAEAEAMVSAAVEQVRTLHRHRDAVAARLAAVRALVLRADVDLNPPAPVRALPTAGS